MEVNRYRKLRKEKGITQSELANILFLDQTTVSKWEQGKVTPDYVTLAKLADFYGVSVDYLLGRGNGKPDVDYDKLYNAVDFDDVYPIPLLGDIAAGKPVFSPENFDGVIYTHYKPKEDYFALRVHGDSMIGAGITDGSIIIARKQETADSGQIVVALLNFDEATVKRYKKIGDQHLLMPENNDYDPIIISSENNAQILGVVVEVRTKV